MVIVSASIFVIGIAFAAQDRNTLKSPSGISLSEFNGYEAWQAVAVSQRDDESGCGTSPAPGCSKLIVGNRHTLVKKRDFAFTNYAKR
jgi:hypothetical protein